MKTPTIAEMNDLLLDDAGPVVAGLGVHQGEVASPPSAATNNVEYAEDVALERDQVEARMQQDFNFLAAVSMPEAFIYLWPMFYLGCFQLLQDFMTRQRDFSKIALGFPRGFAKSTFIKLCVLWAILYTKKRFILVLCANEKLAWNFIDDVADMLDHPNIKMVFGDWKVGIESDRQGYKKFHFRDRDIILAGLGAGSSLRGIVVKNQRPDLMVFDDVQTKEQSESKTESESLERWFWGTAMKAKSPHGCTYIFLANMYPTENSMLRKLKKNSTWVKFISGAILSDGQSLWEELQPVSQLLEEYQADCEAGHPEIFLSEVMNDENIQSNNLLDVSRVAHNPWEVMIPAPIPHGRAIIIDPAMDKKDSDLISIGAHDYYVKPDGSVVDVMSDLVEGRFSPGETIKQALMLAVQTQTRLICVESGAYQGSLLYWFNDVCNRLELTGFLFKEIHHGGRSKNSRVFKLFKQLHAGEVVLHSKVRAHILHQGTSYNPAKTDNTDGALDVTAYGPDVLAKYPGEIIVMEDMQNFGAGPQEVLEHNNLF